MLTIIDMKVGWEYEELQDGTARLIRPIDTDTISAIPGYINGKTVSEVCLNTDVPFSDTLIVPHQGLNVFKDETIKPREIEAKRMVNSGTLTPDVYIHYIGGGAFSFSSLEMVNINGLKHIGLGAFASSKCLTSAYIHGENGNNKSSIGGNACFRDCTSLGKAVIGLPTLEGYFFDGCSELTDVTLCEGICCIRTFAFRNCLRLKKLYIPMSMELIETGAFAGCSPDLEVYVSEKTEIKAEAFPQGAEINFV